MIVKHGAGGFGLKAQPQALGIIARCDLFKGDQPGQGKAIKRQVRAKPWL